MDRNREAFPKLCIAEDTVFCVPYEGCSDNAVHPIDREGDGLGCSAKGMRICKRLQSHIALEFMNVVGGGGDPSGLQNALKNGTSSVCPFDEVVSDPVWGWRRN